MISYTSSLSVVALTHLCAYMKGNKRYFVGHDRSKLGEVSYPIDYIEVCGVPDHRQNLFEELDT